MLNGQEDLRRIGIMSDEHEDKRQFKPKAVSTTIIDDVFTNSVAIVKTVFKVDYDACLGRLWEANPEIHSILKEATDLESAPNAMDRKFDHDSGRRSQTGPKRNHRSYSF